MKYLTVVPAYGRDYKSAKAVKADWDAGKDFRINDMSSRDDGRYINKDDKPADVTLTVRFARLTKTVLIKQDAGAWSGATKDTPDTARIVVLDCYAGGEIPVDDVSVTTHVVSIEVSIR